MKDREIQQLIIMLLKYLPLWIDWMSIAIDIYKPAVGKKKKRRRSAMTFKTRYIEKKPNPRLY